MRSHAKASTRSGAPKARRLVLPAVILAFVLAFAVPQASALKFHAFKEVFGSAAQPSFEARSIAIDQSSGDVLVMDTTGDDSIKRLNPDGTPDNFSALGTNAIDGQGGADTTPQSGLDFASSNDSQIAVDNSGTATDGNIYVTQELPNLINVFSSTGTYLGQLTAAGATNFTEACGVAVDSSGAVYVGDYTGGIHKFVPAANPPVNADHTATFTTTTQPCTLGAGAGATAGFLFPAQLNGPISKIDSSTGELKYTVASGLHTTVTVDPGTGHVYGVGTGTIKEFDASGAVSASAVSTTDPDAAMQGLAVRGSSGDIYYAVSPATTDKIQVLGGAVSTAPDVTTEPASNVGPTTVTLNGTVNPDGVGLSECKFEYGKTTSYGQNVPCAESPATIGSGTSPVSVHADVSGLEANGTEYDFRLIAANPEASANGENQSFDTLGPVIADTWAEDVTVTEAVLKAEINPKGSPTTYHFEYGTSTAYGSETAELNVGSDSSLHKVQLSLEDLQPGTTYHYRIVAINGDSTNEGPDREIRTFRPFVAETDCPNQTNRYGAGASLPDCRAYEMVSPLDKNNGDIRVLPAEGDTLAGLEQSTSSGEKITYSSVHAFGDAKSAPFTSQYIAQRLASGWQTHSINPVRRAAVPGMEGLAQFDLEFWGFSEDLCQGWMANYAEPPLSAGGLAGYQNLYRRSDRLCGPEGFAALAPIAVPSPPSLVPFIYFLGASANGSHAVFGTTNKLTPEGTDGARQLYESPAPGAPLRFVCVLPNDEPHPGPCSAGSGGGEGKVPFTILQGAVSNDGERIFWTAAAGVNSEAKLYVRIGGTETVAVSQAGEELAGTTGSFFQGASADGSRAVYTTGGTANGNLFGFEVDTEATEPIAEGVSGVVGMSEDARRIYFASGKAIPGSGQNNEGEEALAGQPNLYLYDADQGGGTTTFIATLANQDTKLMSSLPTSRTSRVTPDGGHVAFTSTASLTGYDNKGGASGFLNPVAYVYDAAGDELICASCNPSGARGEREVNHENKGYPIIPGFDNGLHAARALSDDGSRLYFETVNSLTPRDTNGQVDVYQWETEGTGGCDAGGSGFAPSAAGCIELISSGKSSVNSEFVEASADGEDVFINTLSGLVPQDYGLRDIYDAKAGGGFPLPPEAPECVGDACQIIPAAPNDPTPASAGFRGAGDPQPRKAKRRCRARNRKGAKQSKAKQKKAKRCRRNNRRAGR